MFLRRVKLVIVLIGFAISLPAFADLQSDVLGCLDKSNNSERLDCYDTVAKYYKSRPSPAKPAQTISSTTPVVQQVAPVSVPVTIPTPPIPADHKKPKSAEDTFGKSVAEDVESIQSKMIGEFSGWKKGMKIKLENGQIWKVTSNKAGYKKMTNPLITITRGFFGSFNAKVEGLNASAKVKRIK